MRATACRPQHRAASRDPKVQYPPGLDPVPKQQAMLPQPHTGACWHHKMDTQMKTHTNNISTNVHRAAHPQGAHTLPRCAPSGRAHVHTRTRAHEGQPSKGTRPMTKQQWLGACSNTLHARACPITAEHGRARLAPEACTPATQQYSMRTRAHAHARMRSTMPTTTSPSPEDGDNPHTHRVQHARNNNRAGSNTGGSPTHRSTAQQIPAWAHALRTYQQRKNHLTYNRQGGNNTYAGVGRH